MLFVYYVTDSGLYHSTKSLLSAVIALSVIYMHRMISHKLAYVYKMYMFHHGSDAFPLKKCNKGSNFTQNEDDLRVW